MDENELINFVPCQSGIIIRKDNHMYNVTKDLREKGIKYYWTWLPIKIGYDLIKKSGWQDSYITARKKDSGFTVEQVIDGWREKIKDTSGMRLDQIWCNKNMKISSSEVIFNGGNYPVVSDHYGVLVNC